MTGPVRAFFTESLRAVRQDRCGTAAVEFALVSIPLILMILMILQMGIYYMAQSALDAGVIQTADTLVNDFYQSSGPVSIPNEAQLASLLISKSGGIIHQDTNFYVELRQFSYLTDAVKPIINSEPDPSGYGNILALRAQASVPVFVPGLGSLATVRSATLVRRQNH